MHAHLRVIHDAGRPAGGPARLPGLLLAAAAGIACAAVPLRALAPAGAGRFLAALAALLVAAACASRLTAERRSRGGALAACGATAALGAGALAASVAPAARAGSLACYALGGLAVVLGGRPRFRRPSWPLVLDSVVAVLTLASFATAAGATASIGLFRLLDLILLALVAVTVVWQGGRPSRESGLLSAGLVLVSGAGALSSSGLPTLADPGSGSGLSLLAAALLLGAGACAPAAGAATRHEPQRWVAIVAPTALSAADLVLVASGRLFHLFSDLTMTLARVGFLFAFARVFISFVVTQRMLANSLRDAASDELTGLANRRALVADSTELLASPALRPHVLAIYDLDGFKQYNDTFGHQAGDTLLSMLGARLAAAVGLRGKVYRLGGDEFCLLAPAAGRTGEVLVEQAAAALTEEGPGYVIRPSYGAAMIREEAADLTGALRLADRRMYEHKSARPAAPQATAGSSFRG